MDRNDQQEIESLLALYGHAADDPSREAIREVFSEDGVFDATDMDAGRHEGAAAIAEFFALGKPPHPAAHHTTNVFVWRDGEQVRAVSKYIAVDGERGVLSGDYRDVLVRTGEGWRIAERIAVARNPPGRWQQSLPGGHPGRA